MNHKALSRLLGRLPTAEHPITVDGELLTISQFEELMGITYAPHVIAPDMKIIRYAIKCYRKGVRKGHFTRAKRWLASFHKDEMATGLVYHTQIKWVDDELGWGLFATTDLPAYTYIGVYTGLLVRRGVFRKMVNDYRFRYPTGIETCRPLLVDAAKLGNELRFSNHSDEANMEGVGLSDGLAAQVAFRTCKPVKAGEQLTYDYGDEFWEARQIKKRLL